MKMQSEDEVALSPPSKLLLLMETRAWAEFGAFLISQPFLHGLPRGDGHPVLVIPGFGGSDLSTQPMRRLFAKLGYATYGWEQGRNMGMRSQIKEFLALRLRELHQEHGTRVSLIGWSLGGVYVREMARSQPDSVRRVITMGSPINGHPNANNAAALFSLINRKQNMKLDWEGFQRRRVPPPVPCTAIYSKTDGIVNWQCSREEQAPNTENVQVASSHFGLGVNPLVMRIIAERLARKEGD